MTEARLDEIVDKWFWCGYSCRDLGRTRGLNAVDPLMDMAELGCPAVLSLHGKTATFASASRGNHGIPRRNGLRSR